MPRTRQLALNYGDAILKLREQRAMTREALAESSGVSPSYLSEVERGLKRPSTDVVAKIAEALGMLPSQFLEYVESTSGSRVPDVLASIATPRKRIFSSEMMVNRLAESVVPDLERDMLAELLTLAGQLDDDDLKVLLALVRRLLKKGT